MPKHPMVSIPLDIPDIRALKTEINAKRAYITTVERTLTTTTCRRCRRVIDQLHSLEKPRLLRHLPTFGRVVYVCIRAKRFRCPFCDNHPTTTQKLEWYDPDET